MSQAWDEVVNNPSKHGIPDNLIPRVRVERPDHKDFLEDWRQEVLRIEQACLASCNARITLRESVVQVADLWKINELDR